MPAVELDKLKLQSANLAGKISQPKIFLSMFREILVAYSNRTYRSQTVAGRIKATPSYHVPAHVIWQIERDLLPQMSAHSQEQFLDAANQLWESPSLEEKTLALVILGNVPSDPVEPVVEAFNKWYSAAIDPTVLKITSTVGSRALRKFAPYEWARIVNIWLESKRTSNLISTIHSMEDSLEVIGESCLPEAFEMMSKILEINDGVVLTELLHMLKLMIRKSRSETVYFIKNLAFKPGLKNQLTDRFLKRCVPLFPEDIQDQLRTF